ncbi:hypothetical protein DAI22_11g234600 [Oryza sativa Japonica Group]|nr:hypothetical protein DAI22_11g234600 [Oryza sativa Japonica Group]KAF2912144.1 hypothetical protein DAI22_11g234600 [Oryza sativa Japonica Group]KAF2912145.1 hypothetical protein DAI22_11g234600 [Oryza sativa Japonica Group]
MDQWRIISSAFENNGTGSRILLTTTIQSVTNRCSHGNGYVYQMNTLGKEDSEELAFSVLRSPELENHSESLLGKCDGLPLALVSVSDYLKSSTEATGELCAKLCRDLGSHLTGNHGHDNFSELRKVLLGNYDSFSSSALSCLLYLGIFPNNHPLRKKVLIRRWLAEGYARSDDPWRSEEDTADDNFSNLIDQNIIQPVDTRNNSEVKTCKTHGIMHEFLLNRSLAKRFITTSPHDPRVGINITNSRHLSVDAAKQTKCMASDEELSRVRSLTIFGDAGDAISYLHKCNLIRVLDLQECSDLNDNHLKRICVLSPWHLKYLNLGGNISELPRSIEELHCLETLDLRETEIKFLPIEAGFITDGRKGFLQLIGHMKKLRKVKIWCRHVEGSSNYIADLSKAIQEFTKAPIDMDRVRSLSIDSEEYCEKFLSSLDLEPCSEYSKYHLSSLKIHGKLLQLPPFFTSLSGLIDLCITPATLTQDHLSALINLNRLLYLKLIADKLENLEIKHGALLSLRRLCFVVKSVALAQPKIEQGALPNLVSLQLLCQGLVGLSGIEIRHLKNLKEVTIDSGVTAQTRQDWEQAAKNHPNRPRVLLLGKVDPVESEEPGRPCAIRGRGKSSIGQESSEDGSDSSLKRMRLAEPSSSSQLQVTGHPHPVVVAATEAASQPSMANL